MWLFYFLDQPSLHKVNELIKSKWNKMPGHAMPGWQTEGSAHCSVTPLTSASWLAWQGCMVAVLPLVESLFSWMSLQRVKGLPTSSFQQTRLLRTECRVCVVFNAFWTAVCSFLLKVLLTPLRHMCGLVYLEYESGREQDEGMTTSSVYLGNGKTT